MVQVSRAVFTVILLVIALGSVGCATSPDTKTDSLDFRLAWPCERLLVTWAIGAKKLQTLVGDDLVVRANNGNGELRLNAMRCNPPPADHSRGKSLLYGYLAVAVAADSAPIVITKIPIDGWSSLLQLVADENTQTLFSQMGYDVAPSNISFAVSGTRIELRLTFADGQIAVVATLSGDSTAHEAERALLSRGTDFVSAFFGPEKGLRYSLVSARVQSQGETPLSQFDLSEIPTTVVFDSGMVSDRIFWRLPLAQQ